MSHRKKHFFFLLLLASFHSRSCGKRKEKPPDFPLLTVVEDLNSFFFRQEDWNEKNKFNDKSKAIPGPIML
jgi:hypothetical protein